MKRIIREIIDSIKKIDRLTGYKLGAIFRKMTNVNTEKHWNDKFKSRGDSWRDFNYTWLMEFLPSDSAFSLLDIGCAMGDGCILLKKHLPNAQINGADFSEVAISKAKQKTKDMDFFVLDVLKNIPPKKYDYITMLSTLEHFDEPYKIVDKCLKFVNKALIIVTPYEPKFDNPRLYSSGEHRFLFNENTFSQYNSKVLKITELAETTNYKYIIYELTV
ncbi:MAG: class I SAM-dependent methyltransferase [PVC group bacterium]|nr:class I SAM-dependent methyltransferase [PVC group bacterium]